jgi:hypothetical protein
MYLFATERSASLGSLVSLPNGVPSVDTLERVFKSIVPEKLESCLRKYGERILSSLAQQQIVIDGKKICVGYPLLLVTATAYTFLMFGLTRIAFASLKKRCRINLTR